MGFEKFGKSGYVSQTKISPMLSYLEKNQLPATVCQKCKRTWFPPRADCPNCKSIVTDWATVDGTCRLVTFTEVHFAPPQFQPDTPYLLGVAELKGGFRVFAPISGRISRDKLKPGKQMVIRPTTPTADHTYYLLEEP